MIPKSCKRLTEISRLAMRMSCEVFASDLNLATCLIPR